MELLHISHQLKHGCPRQRGTAWQRLVALHEAALSGTQVVKAGLVPLLVALLEQVPSHKRADVQNQAACLLLEAAASDLGTEELLGLNCVPQLTAALLSGSFVKKARVTAILGMISIGTQQQRKPDHMFQYCQTLMVLSASSVPEVVTVLSQAGSADAASLAMTLKGLEALVQGLAPIQSFVQAGALEVFAMLLYSLPDPQPTFLLSCDDDNDGDENESALYEEVWLAALGILSQVVLHSLEGSRRIAQRCLRGGMLPILMQCCSSALPGVQLLALTILNKLAAVPEHLPAFSKASGYVYHLGMAMHVPHLVIKTEAMRCIKLVYPFISQSGEQQLVDVLNSLHGPETAGSCDRESSDSSDEME